MSHQCIKNCTSCKTTELFLTFISRKEIQIPIFEFMAGIYIHIPFCKQKCTYCDFYFSTTFNNYRSSMIQCIIEELVIRAEYLEDKEVDTIYFGGGTPSILDGEEVARIVNSIRKHFKLNNELEVTLEANPDDISVERLAEWKGAGINRLSIGVQSFKSSDLDWMNRAHTSRESLSSILLAKEAGFKNLTIDLIYGLPDLSMDEWRGHIQKIIDLNVPHISAYCLTVENNTVLERRVEKGEIYLPAEDIQSEQFLLLLEMLESIGYQQYEISNFALKGFESKHNANYWKGEWYLGVGPSAHSFNGVSRAWNVSNNQQYIRLIETGGDTFESEELTVENQFNEKVLTSLRTSQGLDLKELELIHPLNMDFISKYSSFLDSNWMVLIENKLVLTPEGRLRADLLASELFILEG